MDHADERVAEIELVPRAGDRDVEKTALLLFTLRRLDGARGGEEYIAVHDDEDDIELEALGLLNGGVRDLLRVLRCGLVVLGLDVGE